MIIGLQKSQKGETRHLDGFQNIGAEVGYQRHGKTADWMKHRAWSYKNRKMEKTNDSLMGHLSIVEKIHDSGSIKLEFRDRSIVSSHVHARNRNCIRTKLLAIIDH